MYHGNGDEPFHAMASKAITAYLAALPAPDGLVERLRARRTVNLAWPDDSLLAIQAEQNLCIEAATVIQTLQRERDEILGDFSTTAHALAAAEQQVRDMSGQVEQAFRDGLSYGGNVENADSDIAWQHSRARLLLKEGGE